MRWIGPTRFARLFEAALLDDNMGAGVQITGTSGSGKSNTAEWLLERLARRGVPFLHLDPHGDSARKLHRMCCALPKRIRERIWYVRVADPNIAVGLNPLALGRVPRSDYERLALVRVAVERTAQVIFSLFGETEFGSRPVLRKWLVRWLTLLALGNLTLADALMLVDPSHPFYELLASLAADETARRQMEALAGLRVPDLEAEIGSARNRITGVLEHPTCQTMFSRREHSLDFRGIYDNDVSLIVDLDKGDLLTDDARQLIANLILNQYLGTVLATPEKERRFRVCAIDELPVFASSQHLLQTLSTEIRKFCTKFVYLHQGSSRFPGRHQDPFLQTITEMCRVHLFFRHGAADARFFGEQIALATWGGPRVKHVQRVPQQFTEGHDLVTLHDWSEGSAKQSGTSTNEGVTDQLTETISTAVRRVTDGTEETRSNSRGHSTGRQTGSGTSRSTTRNRSRTHRQTLVARTVTRDVVTSVQFQTPEEIDRDIASHIKKFDTGEAYLQIDGVRTDLVRTPRAVDPYERSPRFGERRVREHLEWLARQPEFTTPERIAEERRAFLADFVRELRTMAHRRDDDDPPRLTNEDDSDAPWDI